MRDDKKKRPFFRHGATIARRSARPRPVGPKARYTSLPDGTTWGTYKGYYLD
jgi:hypothetical protein